VALEDWKGIALERVPSRLKILAEAHPDSCVLLVLPGSCDIPADERTGFLQPLFSIFPHLSLEDPPRLDAPLFDQLRLKVLVYDDDASQVPSP
jgi:hypothetical protein